MPPRQAVLGVENGSFSYGARRVFENVSFLLDDARTALVGENGAGKSTLLKCLTGEQELNRGQIVRSRGLKLGYVPQELPSNLLDLPVRGVLDGVLARMGSIGEDWKIDILLDEIGVSAETAAQPFHTQHADARGRHLERERNAVEAAADFAHTDSIVASKLEPAIGGPGPRDEQVDRAEPADIDRAHGRDGQRVKPVNSLGRDLQIRLAGRQDRQAGGPVEQGLDQRRCRRHQMFAIVEDQQPRLSTDRGHDGFDGHVGVRQCHAERRGRGAHHRRWIGQGRQIDQPDTGREIPQYLPAEFQRQPGLADPARTDECDKPAFEDVLLERREVYRAADQTLRDCRQIRGRGRRAGRVPGKRALGPCLAFFGRGSGAALLPCDRCVCAEEIAPARKGFNHVPVRSEGLAQSGELDGEVILLDPDIAPDPAEDLISMNDLAVPFDQQLENLEGPSPDRDGRPVRRQRAAPMPELEMPEAGRYPGLYRDG